MSEKIKIADKSFELYISNAVLMKNIDRIANDMNRDLKDKNVLFLGVLNGAFMFCAEILKRLNFPCEISFVKVASYIGTQTEGKIKHLIGLNEDVAGRTIVILEDIIDTGTTSEKIMELLAKHNPAEIMLASMFFKPDSFTKNYKIDYLGVQIPNDFVIGFGLDYLGYGRNLVNIYKLKE